SAVVPERQGKPDVVLGQPIAIGLRRRRDRAEMDDATHPVVTAREPIEALRRRHQFRNLMLGDVAPLVAHAEGIADHDALAARRQCGHHIGADESRATRHEYHDRAFAPARAIVPVVLCPGSSSASKTRPPWLWTRSAPTT